MADVAEDARALHLAMRIPKTASPMISARTLTMPAEGQGVSALMNFDCTNTCTNAVLVIRTAELLMMLQWMIFFLVLQMDVRRQIQL
jgi:hypothetical protein